MKERTAGSRRKRVPKKTAAKTPPPFRLTSIAPAIAGILTTIVFFAFGDTFLADLSNHLRTVVLFAFLFGVMMWCAFAVVTHADAVAEYLGEPYGTLILTLSVIVTRIATVALLHTGLSREAAQFQARSAFTGVGFTTTEAETVVNHPVRRRVVMLLMLLGNAGIVAAIASLLLTFLHTSPTSISWPYRILVLGCGLALLWLLATSKLVDRGLYQWIAWALKRWTHIGVRDYTSLLHLSDNYQILEEAVESGDWLANKTLKESTLRAEGAIVVGIQRSDGSYVGAPKGQTRIEEGDRLILYGREPVLQQLDQRCCGIKGDEAHQKAITEQKMILDKQNEREETRLSRHVR